MHKKAIMIGIVNQIHQIHPHLLKKKPIKYRNQSLLRRPQTLPPRLNLVY